MEFIEVQLSGEFDLISYECGFVCVYDGYVLTGMVDCDVEMDEEKDESVGIMKDSYCLNGVTYWYLEVKNNNEEKISLSEELMNKAKHEIENHFDKLVQNF